MIWGNETTTFTVFCQSRQFRLHVTLPNTRIWIQSKCFIPTNNWQEVILFNFTSLAIPVLSEICCADIFGASLLLACFKTRGIFFSFLCSNVPSRQKSTLVSDCFIKKNCKIQPRNWFYLLSVRKKPTVNYGDESNIQNCSTCGEMKVLGNGSGGACFYKIMLIPTK